MGWLVVKRSNHEEGKANAEVDAKEVNAKDEADTEKKWMQRRR